MKFYIRSFVLSVFVIDSHIYSFLLCPIFSGGEVLRDGKWEASYEVELKMKISIPV